MALAAVRSKVVVLLLFIVVVPIVCKGMFGVVRFLFVMQYFVSFLVLGKRELIPLLLLFSSRHVAIIVLCLIFTVCWIDLQCVIIAFSDHTYLRLELLLN